MLRVSAQNLKKQEMQTSKTMRSLGPIVRTSLIHQTPQPSTKMEKQHSGSHFPFLPFLKSLPQHWVHSCGYTQSSTIGALILVPLDPREPHTTKAIYFKQRMEIGPYDNGYILSYMGPADLWKLPMRASLCLSGRSADRGGNADTPRQQQLRR